MAALRSFSAIEILERDGQSAAISYLMKPVAAYYIFQAQDEQEVPDKALLERILQAYERYPALRQQLPLYR